MPTQRLKRKARPKIEPGQSSLVEPSSGNVFADIGLPNPAEHLAKADLVIRIQDIITKRAMTQRQAARILGIDQPKVSALLRGRFRGYTMDRLFRFPNCLDQDITIAVTPTAVQPVTRVLPRQKVPGRTFILAPELALNAQMPN